MSLNITPQQIVEQRAARKKAGVVGCQNGMDMPLTSLRGISWRVDTKGRSPDHPDFDANDPNCFCHDCRKSFDPDGTHDLQLINLGNKEAIRVYGDLIRKAVPLPSHGIAWPPPVNTSIPVYSTFEEIPLTLNAPRARDIKNESPRERLKADLSSLRGEIQGKLIVVMDTRRRAVAMSEEERETFLEMTQEKESKLWAKLDAVDLLLKE